MSYQGDPRAGTGYWSGNGTANGVQGPMPRILAKEVPAQYNSPASMNPQYWTQQVQPQYAMQTAYATNGMYQSAPVQDSLQQQFRPPQYLNPAELVHQQSTPRHQDRLQQPLQPRKISTASSSHPAHNSVAKHSEAEEERPMLLVSLAEEFFDAAHKLAPAVADSMIEENIEAYNELIATGLGCLDTALKNVRLAPRMEAKIRLRYAGILFEETENFMEAETALSKGIVLCERNHYYDLKYAMQFLLAQFMCRKSPRASLKALDGYITDAEVYQHFSWVYAFRFLKALQTLHSSGARDTHSAIQTFRSIASLASQQGDRSVFLVASFMEAMAHLKSTASDAMEHVQRAIAAAYSYQLDAEGRLPQLVGLTHLLDVACSIRQGNPAQMISRLKALQEFIDAALEDPSWSCSNSVVAIPIGRSKHQTVSPDTRSVIGVGDNGQENLIMSFMSKDDAYAINCLLFGAVLLHKNSTDQKGSRCLEQGLASLSSGRRGARASASPGVLLGLLSTLHWRGEVLCHIYLYLAFCEAAVGNWVAVRIRMDELHSTAKDLNITLSGPLEYLTTYLTGVYNQGIGDLDTALRLYQNERFNLRLTEGTLHTSANQLERDVALLAALNTLWILQEDHRQDPQRNSALIAQLTPLCKNHPIKDIETAFNVVVATVKVDPPAPGFLIKNHLRAALAGAQATANTQFLCITLSVMCDRFFVNIVGAQAEKSAMAASVQAKKSGNILWRSVADGMLARHYEVQGKPADARETMEQARKFAEVSWPKS